MVNATSHPMRASTSPSLVLPPDRSGLVYEYANYFEAGFSREEILLRFAQAYEGEKELVDHIRIVMTPTYARALLQLLQSTLARFEAMHAESPGDATQSGTTQSASKTSGIAPIGAKQADQE